MRRRTLNAPHGMGKINVTPLIDVVMCLIIFYLIVGKLAAQRVTLPKSAAGLTDAGPKPLIVEVVAVEGGGTRLSVADKPVDLGALEGIIRDAGAASAGRAVEIRAPRDLPYERLAPVLGACRAAGLTTVRLAAERAR